MTKVGYFRRYTIDKGVFHRLDGGPAVIYPDGNQQWWVNGKRHRLDGPAIIWADGSQEWFVNGKDITKEVINWIKEYNIPDNYTEWTDVHRVQFMLTF